MLQGKYGYNALVTIVLPCSGWPVQPPYLAIPIVSAIKGLNSPSPSRPLAQQPPQVRGRFSAPAPEGSSLPVPAVDRLLSRLSPPCPPTPTEAGCAAVQPKRFPFQPAQRAGISLHKEPQIAQTAQFLHVLCLSAPALGVINMVTSCFQALDKALHSLTITVLRNAVLFIPAVILLNRLWGCRAFSRSNPP